MESTTLFRVPADVFHSACMRPDGGISIFRSASPNLPCQATVFVLKRYSLRRRELPKPVDPSGL